MFAAIDARVQVVDLRRIEAGLGDAERVAQHLCGRLAPPARRGTARRRQAPRPEPARRATQRRGCSVAGHDWQQAAIMRRPMRSSARAQLRGDARGRRGRRSRLRLRAVLAPTRTGRIFAWRAYLIRRLWQMIPTLVGVILLVFFLFKFFGGDPGRNPRRPERHAGADRRDPPAARARTSRCGRQLCIFLKQIVTFDWGKSWATNEAVANLFATRLPATLTVMMPILVLDTLLALPIAMWRGLRARLADRPGDHGHHDGGAVDQLPGLHHRRPVRVRVPARLVPGAGLERQRLDQPDAPTRRCRCCWRCWSAWRRRRACTAASSSTRSATTTCAPRAPRA